MKWILNLILRREKQLTTDQNKLFLVANENSNQKGSRETGKKLPEQSLNKYLSESMPRQIVTPKGSHRLGAIDIPPIPIQIRDQIRPRSQSHTKRKRRRKGVSDRPRDQARTESNFKNRQRSYNSEQPSSARSSRRNLRGRR